MPAGGHKRKGVSGGERKRVSIGHEMLINPSVLMLDGALPARARQASSGSGG